MDKRLDVMLECGPDALPSIDSTIASMPDNRWRLDVTDGDGLSSQYSALCIPLPAHKFPAQSKVETFFEHLAGTLPQRAQRQGKAKRDKAGQSAREAPPIWNVTNPQATR